MRFLPLALLVAFIIAQAASGISSTEAQTVIGGYVGTDNIAKMEALDSVTLRDASYFVFYYPPKPISSNKLVAAILVQTGQVIEDEATLKTLAGAAYQYAVWQRLETAYSLQFSDFSSFLSGFKSRLTATAPASTISQIQAAYPAVSMLQVDKKLSAMEARIDILSENLDQGATVKASFSEENSISNLATVFSHYNKTLASFSEFVAATDAYQAAVLDVQSKVSSSKNLSVDDKTNILKALSPIFEAGKPGKFKDSFVAGKDYYDSRVIEADKWAVDSVSGFLFIKAKADALKAYDVAQPGAQSILKSEVTFTACALSSDWKVLSEKWQEIEALKSRGTKDAYLNLTWKVAQAQSDVVALNDKYNNCISAPAKPAQQDNSNSIIQAVLAVIVLALVGFAAYRYYQQKKAEAEGG